nr:MAG TPA: hypothetical protein [Caudoviricetes sp.]
MITGAMCLVCSLTFCSIDDVLLYKYSKQFINETIYLAN